jgi:hypothetical protein
MPTPAVAKRVPGSLAERFWSIARSTGPSGDDTTSPEPQAVVRHVLRILDMLSAGEVGDGVSTSSISFLQLLRQQEHLGDLSYASPEQARGESLDERSLVFSVGVLMFEELTGRHPFGAMASGRRFARIQKCELGSGVQYFPQVPSELRSVLMRAMGPFPEERYRSLADLRLQLERFVDGGVNEAMERMVLKPRRLLKGLPPTPADLAFAPIEEAIPTMVQPRIGAPLPGSPRPPQPMPQAQPQAQLSAQPTTIINAGQASSPGLPALRLPVGGDARVSTGKVAALSDLPRSFAVLERVAYVVIGALLALLVAYFALRPKATPKVSINIGTASATSAPARNLDPPQLALAEPAPIVFDAELGGRNAAKAARDCFSPDRAAHTIAFGAGLLFGKDSAISRRVYLDPEELSPDERKCMTRVLTGVSAGAAPSKVSVVEYRFRLRPDGSNDIKATLQK